MTVAEFKKKWAKYGGKETSAYQEHFNDLCGILGQKTPAEADPSGSDWFCFQKHVVKNYPWSDLTMAPKQTDYWTAMRSQRSMQTYEAAETTPQTSQGLDALTATTVCAIWA